MLDKVIANGYCVGCGACAIGGNAQYKMEFTNDGTYLPVQLADNKVKTHKEVCPFSDDCINENQIGMQLYQAEDSIQHSVEAGYYLKNYVGYVQSSDFRRNGSSGGMVTWLLSKLLETKKIDYVIHAKPSRKGEKPLFKYGISKTGEELKSGAKSKYYPVEMSQVINFVIENPGRYAFVGVPCFIKAVRLLSKENSLLEERFVYTIALVCGHLKSDHFAKAMAWEMGIHPNNLQTFDFRVKHDGHKANDYGVEAQGLVDGKIVTKQAFTKDLFFYDWGRGFFKLSACDYCDDVIGETADISIGDAWLPGYVDDPMGTNIVTLRKTELLNILEKYSSELHLDEIGIEKIIQSQAGGFRHRREGLAYRLYLKDSHGQYRPKKRVEANADISVKRKRIYELRLQIADTSNSAYRIAEEYNDFLLINQHIQKLLTEYDNLYIIGWHRKFRAYIKKKVMANKTLRRIANMILRK